MNELKILAVDTATEACSAALLVGEKVFSRWEEAPRDHTRKILPMVQAVLDEAGVTLDELDAIAFGRGPGSFTGVRIGIGVAQGLALGAGVPLIGISTLAAMAQGAHRLDGAERVLTAIDARMDEVYFGHYELIDGRIQLVGEEMVSGPAALVASRGTLPGSFTRVGTGFETYGETLAALADELVASQVRFPAAEDMLPLARSAWLAGEAVAVEQATPVYLRDKVTWKKLPGRE
ncbi:tRNA (adenosine(37)-N6)-threonylcarbamoyltransferase complex dimerization subunit type 1 TsaB [Aeromonas dhakensis]|uniref:tRNA (adenosine(37)-N6)-threonylcarbamoyltransferase complex dimerization subunit type 1 TsaB n=1 Tax=Aeromonas dhakensis TaxID=196024 RepID=UPI001BCEF559|nr:tRNA (adenosine(37)-N6)-threonylcarbamoyltransferase complex dimerization subunit type 1 TsaB [Aeromonas dhakensis]MBS4715690.1 tRNA (adenosine(37)-N6)-threonylcarbamoyltransferase complex dimerization subunit type 1 TsaB [Aeromonas dhakensis]BED99040.1 tRNA (adenosine(37)-N6)-threonylcarbamoyltransferase complex dimerization subunit type 1 TsaB [Aeromonas dhakensis]HDZ8877407.1 tRNA (adenosine(37)-N6)-threonylcarbamoyltransferase complex dimerization subunit type 1 TsaB [Aeromonas dhakensis]